MTSTHCTWLIKYMSLPFIENGSIEERTICKELDKLIASKKSVRFADFHLIVCAKATSLSNLPFRPPTTSVQSSQ
jgi:hypothetical protein